MVASLDGPSVINAYSRVIFHSHVRRCAADRSEYRQAAGFASEIKRALNQGLIESVTYDRGAIFFDAHLGPE